MVIWLILGILLVILAICLEIAIIHESDEKIDIIISYVGFITGLLDETGTDGEPLIKNVKILKKL